MTAPDAAARRCPGRQLQTGHCAPATTRYRGRAGRATRGRAGGTHDWRAVAEAGRGSRQQPAGPRLAGAIRRNGGLDMTLGVGPAGRRGGGRATLSGGPNHRHGQ